MENPLAAPALASATRQRFEVPVAVPRGRMVRAGERVDQTVVALGGVRVAARRMVH